MLRFFYILMHLSLFFFFFFFNDTATTEIYTLSLHDALPISESKMASRWRRAFGGVEEVGVITALLLLSLVFTLTTRSEEHTSELQSRSDLVCRLLLEKKKNKEIQRNLRTLIVERQAIAFRRT